VSIPIEFILDRNPKETPESVQELLNSIADSMTTAYAPSFPISSYVVGQLGGTLPLSNVGPWANGSEWWFWDPSAGAYVRGQDGVPVGSIFIWGGTGAPDNWLICDGSEVSRTQYNLLYQQIGNIWGPGDGLTTFNLPPGACMYLNIQNVHFQPEVAPQAPHTLGSTGGSQIIAPLHGSQLPACQVRVGFFWASKVTQVPSQATPVSFLTGETGDGQFWNFQILGAPPNEAPTSDVNQTQLSNMPPFAAANFIIKFQ